MTTQQSEHTPLPWQLSGVRLTSAPQIGKDTRLLQVGPDGDILALVFFDMKTGRGHADAKLIVTAVNERPNLLARIKRLEEALRKAEGGLASNYQVCDYPANGRSAQDRALAIVRAALAE